MSARTASASGQSRSGGDVKCVPRACSHDVRIQPVAFQLGDHVCWAVRPDYFDTVLGNGERGSPDRENRNLCGWLRIGREVYLVLSQTEKVDDAVDSAP